MKTAVIGLNFGRHHAEKLKPDWYVDLDFKRAQQMSHPGSFFTADYRGILGRVDAAVICTPPESHYRIARDFLEAGAKVFVEKPVCRSLDEFDELSEMGVLRTSEIETFGPAFRELNKLVPSEIYAVRKGGRKHKWGVVLDLMIHDIMVACSLAGPGKVVVSRNNGVTAFAQIEHMDCKTILEASYEGSIREMTVDGVTVSFDEDFDKLKAEMEAFLVAERDPKLMRKYRNVLDIALRI